MSHWNYSFHYYLLFRFAYSDKRHKFISKVNGEIRRLSYISIFLNGFHWIGSLSLLQNKIGSIVICINATTNVCMNIINIKNWFWTLHFLRKIYTLNRQKLLNFYTKVGPLVGIRLHKIGLYKLAKARKARQIEWCDEAFKKIFKTGFGSAKRMANSKLIANSEHIRRADWCIS